MYSVVMMMALSNGAAPADVTVAQHVTAHHSYRGGHGCCGCNGGGRGHRGHGCCGCYGYSGCCGYNQCGCCGYNQCGCCGYVQQCGCCGDGGYMGGHGGAAPAPAKAPAPKKASIDAPATIVVSLPANAVLTIDDEVVAQNNSTTRTLITPALTAGEYSYVLKAEVDNNGEKLSNSKKITVRPGEETQVSFEFIAATARN